MDRVSQGVTKNRGPLLPNRFYMLPLASVKPKGWVARQLQIQADGITGHLDEFWSDLGPNSAWLGGLACLPYIPTQPPRGWDS